MTVTYRLDIRYIQERGVNALRRVDRLTDALGSEGFSISDVSLFDDGMRVSLLVESPGSQRVELKLLALVSETGSIGRFSCREANEVEFTPDSDPRIAENAPV